MIYTTEQTLIIYSESKCILIEALAGTGKTTTLKEYASQRRAEKILYLVYNRNMRKEAQKKFPGNVEVHTVNSFVYKNMKSSLPNPLINEYGTTLIINSFDELKNESTDLAIEIAISAINYFNSYLNSSYKADYFFQDISSPGMKFAKMIYERINKDRNFPITHSVLVKKFLDESDFSKFNFDSILIDEAQDLDRSMLNIVDKLDGKKVFVGDTRQAIYGFRNTINIFESDMQGDRFSLTNSYRFGSNIAELVNKITEIMYGSPVNIKGLGDEVGEIIYDKSESVDGPYTAYITRTNAHLFDVAFDLSQKGYDISIPYDWELIKEILLSAFYLKVGLNNKVTSKQIKGYPNFEYFKEVVKRGGDTEMSFVISVVEKHGLDLPKNLKKLETSLANPRYADYILVTAHRSKGLEFFNVIMGDDFPININNIEEKNLVYVALTRAIEKIKVNNTIRQMLQSQSS